MTGRLIALEGVDGVGKTTLAQQLTDLTYADALLTLPPDRTGGDEPAPGVQDALVWVPRRQITATAPYAAGLMQHLSTMLWGSGDDPCLSDAFWVATQAAWGVAHTETVLAPLLDAGYDVLVDGWFYKFFAKLALQGWAQPDVDVIFARVRMPDAVVLLTADLGAVYDRREHGFRPAELGMHAGYPVLDRTTFLRYQDRTQQHLLATAQQQGWTTVALDTTETVAATVATLRPHLHAARAGAVDLSIYEILEVPS